MENLTQKPVFWIVIYLVMVLGKSAVTELLKLIREIANSASNVSGKSVDVVKSTNERVFKTLENIIDLCIDALSTMVNSLNAQIKHVSQQLTSQASILASRVLGALISLIVLLVFLYADIALGFQALQTLFPSIEVPIPFQNIGIALVAASVGTIFASGILFWDAAGYSEYTSAAQLKGLAKGVFMSFVVLTAILTLGCAFLIALNRAPVAAGLLDIARFSDETQAEIQRLAAYAHSVIVIPMLITTFMMFRGVHGLFVIYLAVIFSAKILFLFIQLLLKILRKAVAVPGIGDAIAMGLLFSITNLVLVALGWMLGLAFAGVAALTSILQAVLNVITTPTIVVWDFIIPIIKSFLTRENTPNTKKKSDQQIDEIVERLERSHSKDSRYDSEYQ